MKLIIDIEKDYYEILKHDVEVNHMDYLPCTLIANGTPLEAQPTDAVSRSEALKRIDAERQHLLDIKMDGAEHILVHHARRIIEDLPSVTPRASEEDIHREREQAYMLGYEDASKKFRTEPCEDCISRQAVIILIDEASEMHPYKVVGDYDTYSNYNQGWSDACDWLYANIEGVPPVTPQRSKGHNENNDYADCDQFVCSKCGIELQDWHRVERDIDDGDITYHEYTFRYCPNCGSYNGGGDDADSD